MRNELKKAVICVIGLGYVGFPLATEFAKHFRVIGLDSSANRVRELQQYQHQNFIITTDATLSKEADFHIIAVPTPLTKFKTPDLTYVLGAARTVSQNMKSGCTVILESSVYPGVTEQEVVPILSQSGLIYGQTFRVGYSPERVNPGDNEHTVDRITKIVSGMDKETTELVAELYQQICPSVFRAKSIQTAEAAKLVENIQRDINIALVNELSLIFERIGLNTGDVLAAAGTKWNFVRYSPGLVGGHCIPVVPYYMVYKAREAGYHPQVILAGRSVNDYMPVHVAQSTIKALNNMHKVIRDSKVLIMGLTYKENVPDIRESPSREIIGELREYGVQVIAFDPLLENIERDFGVPSISNISGQKDYDCIIITVKHDDFNKLSLEQLKAIMKVNPILVDVRSMYTQRQAEDYGFHYITL